MSFYSTEYHAMMMSPGPAGGKTPGGVIPINYGQNSSQNSSQTVSQDSGQNSSTSDTAAKPHESFLHHLWNVINPFQHIPVVGTIYRAVTGEHLDPVEKIAGDTLYGGLWGAVSSIADVAFEGLTGKSVEDTAMALLKGDGKTNVASTKVTAPVITADASLPSADLPELPSSALVAANQSRTSQDGIDVAALTSALSAKGVDSDTASRALYAYRRSMGMNVSVPVLATVH